VGHAGSSVIHTAPLLRIVRSFREGVVTEPWFDEAVRAGIRNADAGHLVDHADVKATWQAKGADQME
jgi:predicted transcriptional regulator